ncbi:MAG: hypothetical protein M1812_000200 [Candelaria pacifica]|nr:MAG: hypothetical protein M1812_000200 [Candelaria pacifica]
MPAEDVGALLLELTAVGELEIVPELAIVEVVELREVLRVELEVAMPAEDIGTLLLELTTVEELENSYPHRPSARGAVAAPAEDVKALLLLSEDEEEVDVLEVVITKMQLGNERLRQSRRLLALWEKETGSLARLSSRSDIHWSSNSVQELFRNNHKSYPHRPSARGAVAAPVEEAKVLLLKGVVTPDVLDVKTKLDVDTVALMEVDTCDVLELTTVEELEIVLEIKGAGDGESGPSEQPF